MGNEHTAVYQNPDHTYTARVSPDRVQYQLSRHTWAPINNTLEPTGSGGWTKTADSQAVRLAGQAADPSLASLAPDGTHDVTFGLAGAAASTAQVSGSMATYRNVFPGVDLQEQAVDSGVQENFVLHSANAPTSYVFPYSAQGLTAATTAQGNVVLTNAAGAAVVTIPHGSMTDSAINPRSNEGASSSGVSYQLITYQGRPALQVSLDAAWLRDPARQFPVTVDPTSLTSTSSTYVESVDNTGVNSGSALLNIGSFDNGIHEAAADLAFGNFGSTFNNDWVRGAWLTVYDAFDTTCTPEPVSVAPITSPWSASTLSDANDPFFPGVSFGAALGTKNFAASPNCVGVGTQNWSTIGLNPSEFDQWAHGTTANDGLLVYGPAKSDTSWKQLASDASANQPYLTIDYSPYGVNWTGTPVWSTTPTANTAGVLQVPLQNWGTTAWTSTNGYVLHYTMTNAATGAVINSASTAMPSTVAAQQSATVPVTFPAEPAGTLFNVVLDMRAPGNVPFSSYLAPTESFTYQDADIAPQISGLTPPSNVTEGMLTPTFSAQGFDPDNYPNPLEFGFWVCPATATFPTGCTSSGWLASGVTGWTVPANTLVYNQPYYWIAEDWDGLEASYPSAPSWFSTIVGQPVVTSHLAQNTDSHGYDPEAGNYTTSATDLTMPGAGLPLTVQRTYNSLDPRSNGAFGAGWWSVMDMVATPDADGTGNVVVSYPDGHTVRFGKNADGSFTSPEGTYATITTNGTTGYTLIDKTDTKYVFTGASGASSFKIASITDHAGHIETFNYANGLLSTWTNNTTGRSLYVTWSTPTGASYPHVASVHTGPVTGTNQSTDITVNYQYSGDQLTAQCPVSLQSQCTDYSYITGAHNADVVQDASPFSYWRFDDPAGSTTAADAVLENEGADNAPKATSTFGVTGPNATTTATSFNGTSSFVQLPSGQVSSSTFLTIQLWFETTASGTAQMLFSTDHSAPNASNPSAAAMPVLYVGTDNKLHGHFWDGTTAGMSSPAVVNDGKWHQVTITGSVGSQALYLDGAPIGSETGQLHNTDSYDIVGAGVFNSNGWPDAPGGNVWSHFNGSIADVSYYPRPLSAIQTFSQYQGAKATAALLSKITLPSGKTQASMAYDMHTERLTSVTDINGGTWTVGAPGVSGTSAIYRAGVLGSNPFGYWRLGDAAGPNAANEVGGSVTGAYTQTSAGVQGPDGTYSNTTLGVQGPFGQNDETAASFNGTSSSASLPDVLYGGSGYQGPASVELWFQTTRSGVLFSYSGTPITSSSTASSQDPEGYVPALYVGTDGKLYGSLFNSQEDAPLSGYIPPINTSRAVNDNKWHHVVITSDGVNLQTMYLDGAEIGSQSYNPYLYAGPVGSQYTYVGAGFTGGSLPAEPHQSSTSTTGYPNYFAGSIAEVAVYERQLGATEITNHHKAYGNSISHASPTIRTEIQDPSGHPLDYTYDPYNGGRLVTSSDQLGNVTSYGYDTSGFQDTVVDPNRNEVIIGHDVRGNVVSRTTCQDSSTDLCATQYYTYFPDDVSTELTPDPRNDHVTSYRDGRSANSVDLTYETRSTYDANGNLLSKVTPPVPGSPNGRITATSYTDGTSAFPAIGGGNEPSGLPVTTTTPGGATTSYRYFADGDVAQTTNADGLVTNYTYDNIGRMLTATQISNSYPGGLTTTYIYDAASRQISMTQPGVTDHVTGVVHTANTSTAYNADSDILTQTVSDTTGGDSSHTTTYTYDGSDRKASMTDPTGAKTNYSYDAFGHQTSVTNPAAAETDYSYDADGRQITAILVGYTGDPANPTTPENLVTQSRAYDPAGRLASVTDSMGRVTQYTYYGDGSLSTVDQPNPAGGSYQTASYGYDLAGNIDYHAGNNYQLTTGSQAQYQYDAGNQVTSATKLESSGLTTTPYAAQTTTLSYDPDDHPISTTTSDSMSPTAGKTTNYTYDPMGHLTSQTVQSPVAAQASAASLVSQWNLSDGNTTTAADGSSGATANPPTTLPFNGTSYAASQGQTWDGQAAKMIFQADGNLVLYRNSDNTALWSSGTGGSNANAVLVFQTDGNLVIYSNSARTTVLWSSGTGGNPGDVGALDGNGNLTISSSGGTQLWSTGTAQDGFNNPGTLSGGARWDSRVYSQGQSGPANGAWFDGVSGQIATPGPVVNTAGSFSVSLWADPATLGSAYQTLAVQEGKYNSGFYLEWEGINNGWAFARMGSDAAGATRDVATETYGGGTQNQWVHLVGVYNAPTGAMTLYVDGVAQRTATDNTPFNATGPLELGHGFVNGGADNYFNGDLSDVQVYSRALSPSEIFALYQQNTANEPGQNGLVGSWSLADGATSTASNQVDTNDNGTTGYVGVTWTTDSPAAVNYRGSAQFDGISGTISTSGAVVNTAQSYSVSLWAKPTTLGSAYQTVAVQQGNQQSGFYLEYEGSKWGFARANSDTANSSTEAAQSTSAAQAGVWTHLVGVYNATTGAMTLYVNGTAQGTVNDTTPFNATGPFVLGHGFYNGAADNYFNGRVSGVQAYQTALTPSQVSTLYSGGSLLQPVNSLTTSLTLDQRGLPTSMTDPRGNAPGATKSAYTTGFVYDEAGHLAATTDPTVNTQVDGGSAVAANPITMTGYDTFGDAVQTQDADGNITTTAYDGDSRPTTVTQPSYTPPGASSALTPVTTTSYNSLGETQSVTDPLGNTTSSVYDQLGDLATETEPQINGNSSGGVWHYTYDTDGEQLAATDPTGGQTQATYDYLGRKITGTQIIRASGVSLANTTNYGYDNQGDLSTITSQDGVTTSDGFNNAGEMVSSTDGAGNTTAYSYANGRRVSTVEPDDTSTTDTYDIVGNLIGTANLNAAGQTLSTTSATYDAVGNKLSSTDATGAAEYFGYDALNRENDQLQLTSPTTSILTDYGYDAVGNPTSYTNGTGNQLITTYNTLGRPESQIAPSTPSYTSLAGRTTTTAYNADGMPTTTTAPGGVTTTDSYDALGDLTQQIGAGAEAATTTRAFGYDLDGRMTSASAPGGTDTFGYDDAGNLLTTSGPSGNSSFTYNGDNQMATSTGAAGTATYMYAGGLLSTTDDPITGTSAGYDYNSLNQVSQINYGYNNDVQKDSYNSRHQLTSQNITTSTGAPVTSISYGYDLDGRETSQTTAGFTGASANTYTYDQAGRLTSWNNGSNTANYSYDNDGNRTAIGSNTLTYNARDQLTGDSTNNYAYTARGALRTITPKAGGTATQLADDAFNQQITDSQESGSDGYDALGRLVSNGGSAMSYTGMGNQLAADQHGTTYSRNPNGDIIATDEAGNKLLTETDQHGNLVGTFAPPATALQDSTTYSPLGVPVAASGLVHSVGYQSGFTDPTTGLVNMDSRWYNPNTGQFTNADSITNSSIPDTTNANPYAYANDDPLTGTDPTGHLCVDPTCLSGDLADFFDNPVVDDIGEVGGDMLLGGAEGCEDGVVVGPEGCAGGGLLGIVAGFGIGIANLLGQGEAYDFGEGDGGGDPLTSNCMFGFLCLPTGPPLPGPPAPPSPIHPLPVIIPLPSDVQPSSPSAAHDADTGQPHPASPTLGNGSGNPNPVVINTPVITPIGIAPNKSTQYDPQDAPATAGAGGGGGGGNGPGTGTLTGNPGPFGGIPLLGLLNLISGLINLQNCKGALSCTAAALAFLPGGGALDGLTTSEGLDGLAGDESGLASDCAIGATHSFAGSTQVLMADDTSEPIKDVKVGDVIKNAEPDGKTETHKVDDVHTTRTDTDFTDLTVSTGKSSSMVTSTQNHPYWDVTQDQFVTAANLHVGDRLQTDSNTTVTVATVRNYTASQVTYDLTIDDLHTYYVEAGNTPVLVHNAGGCGPLDNGYKWPRNNGFEGPSVTVNIPDGYQFDRYGGIPDKDPGRFASPAGTPFEMRGLPSSSLSRLFTTYEVVRPFDVQTGMVRPWGGQPGGGFQLNFSSSIAELLKEGYIRVVP